MNQSESIKERIPGSDLTLARPENDDLSLVPVIDLQNAKGRLEELQQFVKFYLIEGSSDDGADYGKVEGIKKPILFKPGADKLLDVYGLADDYTVKATEDWDRIPPLFDFTVECRLTKKRTGKLVRSGWGSCSSYESKYRYRDQNRQCPECGKESIIRGKNFSTGKAHGWVCWKKKGGCGSNFADGDQSIEAQPSGRVDNENLADIKNTLLKMAKKRALIDATLAATRSSGLFTQDLEDVKPPETKTIDVKAEPPPPTPMPTPVYGKPVSAENPAGEAILIGTVGPPQPEKEGESPIRKKGGTEYIIFTIKGESFVHSVICDNHELMPVVMNRVGRICRCNCETTHPRKGQTVYRLVSIDEVPQAVTESPAGVDNDLPF